jgi:hypothetical protein
MTYICMPKSFDSWLRYEIYANWPYSPREQVNLFLRKLSPLFTPAVSRILRLLDSWNPFDNSTPEVFKLTSLPNTIECFLLEETGTPHPLIRRMQDKRYLHHKGQSSQGKGLLPQTVTNYDQTLKDIYCQYCGTHGHTGATCAFMAKLLIVSESQTQRFF